MSLLQSTIIAFTVITKHGGGDSQERKRHININIFVAGDPSGDRGVSRPGGQGSKFYVLSSEPKEHKSFCTDTRPGRPVTGVTSQSFMCQSFMCLFCSLDSLLDQQVLNVGA